MPCLPSLLPHSKREYAVGFGYFISGIFFICILFTRVGLASRNRAEKREAETTCHSECAIQYLYNMIAFPTLYKTKLSRVVREETPFYNCATSFLIENAKIEAIMTILNTSGISLARPLFSVKQAVEGHRIIQIVRYSIELLVGSPRSMWLLVIHLAKEPHEPLALSTCLEGPREYGRVCGAIICGRRKQNAQLP